MTNDLKMKGIQMVVWTFDAKDGTEIQIQTQAYWVPGAKARLLSSQKLYNKKKCVFGHYQGDEDIFHLFLNNGPAIEIPCDSRSGLPIRYAHTGATPEPHVNVILTDENQNLTSGKTYYSTGIINLHISTSLEYNTSFTMSISSQESLATKSNGII
jgi:hypothetical protein